MPADPDFVARRDEGFTPNPAWEEIDNYTMSHLHPASRPNHKHLDGALKNSKAKGLPPIESSPVQGKFLALQCRLANVKNVLEVGTLGGYTPIWIATENPEYHVTSIGVDSEHAQVAQENIASAGVSDCVTVLVGSALDILPKMLAEIEAGKSERFGMSFMMRII
jgi:predicted O-methyltransferase YrrM